MAIDFQHKEYKEHIDQWEMIDAVCEADDDVQKYLIELNPLDRSPENRDRNKSYRERAVFYPVAARTTNGLLSMLFNDWPRLEVPTTLDYLATNCDGSGTSIYQQSQCVAEDIISIGRNGLFVTYPEVEGPLSRADMASGRYTATIHEIDADRIINWRLSQVGSQMKLSLVVFREEIEEVQPDGYEVKCVTQLRELALVDGVFFDRKWRKNKDDDTWFVFSESTPRDGSGNQWDEIPFIFVGAKSNTTDVDKTTMYYLAKLNIAHYRNSADYEDSTWFAGQAQPWMSGVTSNHIKMMQDNNMYVGSRNMLGVPAGETFGFASAPPNPAVRQAMMDKLDAMIGLGARYLQPNGASKTATQAENEAAITHSDLSLISSNISEAYTLAIQWVARYMNVTLSENDGYTLNKEFIEPDASPQEIQAIIAGFIQGAIPASDYFRWLQKVDLTDDDKTFDEWSQEMNINATMPDLGDAGDALGSGD